MTNQRLQDIGDLFVDQFSLVQRELEEAQRVAKEHQKKDNYESLADSIDKKMYCVRQMYQQLEKRFDQLCEETGYVSEFKVN